MQLKSNTWLNLVRVAALVPPLFLLQASDGLAMFIIMVTENIPKQSNNFRLGPYRIRSKGTLKLYLPELGFVSKFLRVNLLCKV